MGNVINGVASEYEMPREPKSYSNDSKKLAYKEAYENGYADGLSVNVSIMNPMPDEYVVLFYDIDSIDLINLANLFKELEEKIPTANIIALPNSTCLKNCDVQFLEQYIELIKNTIKMK